MRIQATVLLSLGLMGVYSWGHEPSQSEVNWLYGHQIELYAFLLRGSDSNSIPKEKLQEGFHRLAFESWLRSCIDPSAARPRWRGYMRGMLHAEARSVRHWNDPGALTPFFRNGKLDAAGAIVFPIEGLDMNTLTEEQYRQAVRGFQLAYCDLWTLFPASPPPSKPVRNESKETDAGPLAVFFEGRRWTQIRADRLPLNFSSDPGKAFSALTPDAQAYYLPAFMRMCEMENDRVRTLPGILVSHLAGRSTASVELRSRFTTDQKQCIVAFFEP